MRIACADSGLPRFTAALVWVQFRDAPFFGGLAARSSRSSRAAVRFFAAASDAFFARADRSSGVMFFAAALPPLRPKVRAISVIAARTSGGIFMPISQIVYLTGYGAST